MFGIFGGFFADNFTRKYILCISCLFWTVTTLITGLVDSFIVMVAMRFALGVFEAFFIPAAYSIISDMFSLESRTTANSVFNLGIYFGGGLASLSTSLIVLIGWRKTYEYSAYVGFFFALLGFLIIREPQREAEGTSQNVCSSFLAAMKELFVNKTCRWTTIAGGMRFFGGLAIANFMPKYFGKVYSYEST